MNEMIERVARAICFHEVRGQFDCLCAGASACKRWRDGFDDAARCVLLALREPTEAMRRAGICATATADAVSTPDERAVWKAMIDAALTDG